MAKKITRDLFVVKHIVDKGNGLFYRFRRFDPSQKKDSDGIPEGWHLGVSVSSKEMNQFRTGSSTAKAGSQRSSLRPFPVLKVMPDKSPNMAGVTKSPTIRLKWGEKLIALLTPQKPIKGFDVFIHGTIEEIEAACETFDGGTIADFSELMPEPPPKNFTFPRAGLQPLVISI